MSFQTSDNTSIFHASGSIIGHKPVCCSDLLQTDRSGESPKGSIFGMEYCILNGLKCTDMCKLKEFQNQEEDDILTEIIDIENRDDSSEDED